MPRLDAQKSRIDTTRTFTLTVIRLLIGLSLAYVSVYIAVKNGKVPHDIGEYILTLNTFLWVFFVLLAILLFRRLTKQENILEEMDDGEEEGDQEPYWKDGEMGHRKRKE